MQIFEVFCMERHPGFDFIGFKRVVLPQSKDIHLAL